MTVSPYPDWRRSAGDLPMLGDIVVTLLPEMQWRHIARALGGRACHIVVDYN
jgi:hypothetical protein